VHNSLKLAFASLDSTAVHDRIRSLSRESGTFFSIQRTRTTLESGWWSKMRTSNSIRGCS